MLKITPAISKAIIGPFNTTVGQEAYIEFQAQGAANVTFLLDPHTEQYLQGLITTCANKEQVVTALHSEKPYIKKYLNDKYKNDDSPDDLFNFSVERVSVGEKLNTLQNDEVIAGPYEAEVSHSHPGTMGVDYTPHVHISQISFRLKSLGDEAINVSEEASEALHESLREILSRNFLCTSMEAIGQNLFAHIDEKVTTLKQDGTFSDDFQLQAVEVKAPYKGDYDHPNTPVIFITERAPDIAA